MLYPATGYLDRENHLLEARVERVSQFAPEQLRGLRVDRGLAVAELAELAGVRRSQVWTWEAGTVAPTPRSIRSLATALGVDPLRLIHADASQPTLREMRIRAGLSREEVSARVGISHSSCYRLEHGVRIRLSSELIARLAATLDVDFTDVIAGIGRAAR